MTTAYPPHRLHTSNRIPQSRALSLLSAYLEATATDPSLHPNALLTENGPIAPSSGSGTGLVLHNLKRVEAGLRGEHLAADLTFENFGGEGLPQLMPGAGETSVGSADRAQAGKPVVEKESEWQDKEEFEREQEVVEGDIGKRNNALDRNFEGEGGKVPTVKTTKSSNEKEERKRAKKQRRKQGRASLEAKRKRERDAEG